MSLSSQKRSEDFLKISAQFKLGALVTESSHPVTANLSEVAKQDVAAALKLLFEADDDVIKKFREFAGSDRAGEIKETILRTLKNGGRIFFTGCGSTGRLSILLDSIWRDFWQQQREPKNPLTRPSDTLPPSRGERDGVRGPSLSTLADEFENRTFSVMAGGDYALIKSVEGFEDFTAFGKKQITDLSVSSKDVVFAITEGGETSFVIGTAGAGVDAGAKVYFVYNNPDEILCEHVQRSREVIQDSRIEKINLTTGPMAITGSTRMQATSIQLCVMLTILEMVAQDLMSGTGILPVLENEKAKDRLEACPTKFLAKLEELHAGLKSPDFLAELARIVALEESVYRGGHKNNYFADRFGADVLTDTTERSPTYCTPPFRKFDDTTAAESWSFLFLPDDWTDAAWENILKRKPRCVEWNEAEVRALVDEEKVVRTLETLGRISSTELMHYKIGSNGARFRSRQKGDSAVAILSSRDPVVSVNYFSKQLNAARERGERTALVYFGIDRSNEMDRSVETALFVPVPPADFLLDGVTRVAVKLVMNALSTCTMVRLGRVMGNYMVWVVPSNLKLIDRATRYITKLTDLNYEAANALLFEIIEYVEPRMKSDQSYPPVVGMAVLRAKEKLTNEQAEERLKVNSSL
jgi:N-acetylmuramic acid 6-phosphate etherase